MEYIEIIKITIKRLFVVKTGMQFKWIQDQDQDQVESQTNKSS